MEWQRHTELHMESQLKVSHSFRRSAGFKLHLCVDILGLTRSNLHCFISVTLLLSIKSYCRLPPIGYLLHTWKLMCCVCESILILIYGLGH